MTHQSLLLAYCIFQLVHITASIVLSPIERFALDNRLIKIKLNTKERFNTVNEERASDLVLIFPGAGGPDQFTEELETTLTSYLNVGTSTAFSNPFAAAPVKSTVVKTLDWQEFRGTLLTAAYDGEAFGESIADILWNQCHQDQFTYSSIHCVGICVGAFAANACANVLSEFRQHETDPSVPYLRLTLLDPFTSRGVLGSSYGDDNFGLTVDYAEQYLNTDDPVPSTNAPLPLCACIDVTGALERDSFELPENESYHCWPLVYFARYGYKDSVGNILIHDKDGSPSRGSVLIVSS